MDVTAAQALIDVRNQLARYAAPDTVEWRFANIQSRWTKRALSSAGFGYRSPESTSGERLTSIFSIADLGDPDAAGVGTETQTQTQLDKNVTQDDVEQTAVKEVQDDGAKATTSTARLVAVHGMNRPYFHVDLQEALEAAIARIEAGR